MTEPDAESNEGTAHQMRCPECGRFASIGAIPAPGPSAGVQEIPCCLVCGVNPPTCSFEDGSVRGCTTDATHEGAPEDSNHSRPWCSDHAPDDAGPYPYAEVNHGRL